MYKAIDVVRINVDNLNGKYDTLQDRPILIGCPNQIKIWREIYGDSVGYIESNTIQGG